MHAVVRSRPVARNQVWLVRHGETAWSRTGQHTGRTDVPLTDLGRRQARSLGARLGRHRFALVLTSPLSRAAETARLAGFAAAAPTDDLREWDYGAYEGRTSDDIRRDAPGWNLWADGVPGGETVDQVAARVDRVIARCRAVDGDTLLFAHGHVLRVLAARWLGLPPTDGCLFGLSTATVGVLGYEHEWPVVVTWNEGGAER
jgi:broad specificity phosphatase PhoE